VPELLASTRDTIGRVVAKRPLLAMLGGLLGASLGVLIERTSGGSSLRSSQDSFIALMESPLGRLIALPLAGLLGGAVSGLALTSEGLVVRGFRAIAWDSLAALGMALGMTLTSRNGDWPSATFSVFVGAMMGGWNRFPPLVTWWRIPAVLLLLPSVGLVALLCGGIGYQIGGLLGGWIAAVVGLFATGIYLLEVFSDKLDDTKTEKDRASYVASKWARADRVLRRVWLLVRLTAVLVLLLGWWNRW
jgi:hypothetical protein